MFTKYRLITSDRWRRWYVTLCKDPYLDNNLKVASQNKSTAHLEVSKSPPLFKSAFLPLLWHY